MCYPPCVYEGSGCTHLDHKQTTSTTRQLFTLTTILCTCTGAEARRWSYFCLMVLTADILTWAIADPEKLKVSKLYQQIITSISAPAFSQASVHRDLDTSTVWRLLRTIKPYVYIDLIQTKSMYQWAVGRRLVIWDMWEPRMMLWEHALTGAFMERGI